MNKIEVGKLGEDLAVETLECQGYVILDRNWRGAKGKARASGERSNRGELDIVALDGDTLVGIEVKTRTGTKWGHPAEAITPQKVARLRRLLGQWLTENRGTQPQLKWGLTEIRLDAIGVVLTPKREITHFRGIS